MLCNHLFGANVQSNNPEHSIYIHRFHMEVVKCKIDIRFQVEGVKYEITVTIRSRSDAPDRLIACLHQYKRLHRIFSPLICRFFREHYCLFAADMMIPPRWSSRAVRSFAMAELEARKMRYPTTGTEGLLMGILVEGEARYLRY
jgi:hypothetical protein